MKSIVFLLLTCLAIAGTVTAANIEASSVACTDDTFAGLTTGTGIGVVEVSGHGDTRIDGALVLPAGVGTYKGYETRYYPVSEGSHIVLITSEGYYTYSSTMPVCNHKVSYVYYDKALHPIPGMTTVATTAATTTTVETTTTIQYNGQSADLKAALAAGATNPQGSFGSLSVTTDPAGATIYVDGAVQGITPATISGIAAGSHTMLLKLDGYDDLTLPVTISAGGTQYYSSALKKGGAASGVSPGTVPTRKSSAPGFGAACAACVAGALLLVRRTSP
jgi:hypothetical protein